MTIGLGIGIAFLLIAISSTLGVYGLGGGDIAVQISLPLCAYNITMEQAVFLMGGAYVVSGIFYSVITMFLSEGMNNSIAVMGTMIGCTLLTSLLSLPYNLGIISRIYGLLPSVLLNMEKLCDGRLIHIFRAYFTNFKAAPMIYVATSVGLILGVKRIYDNYQVKG